MAWTPGVDGRDSVRVAWTGASSTGSFLVRASRLWGGSARDVDGRYRLLRRVPRKPNRNGGRDDRVLAVYRVFSAPGIVE